MVGEEMRPNRSLEPIRNGRFVQAPISFWAFRAQPPFMAQLRREASQVALHL